jgi:hypothetical protein
MKQTAVEWLRNKMLIECLEPSDELFEQAQDWEKQQIMDAFYEGMNCQNFDPNKGRAEIYYNETFKTK